MRSRQTTANQNKAYVHHMAPHPGFRAHTAVYPKIADSIKALNERSALNAPRFIRRRLARVGIPRRGNDELAFGPRRGTAWEHIARPDRCSPATHH